MEDDRSSLLLIRDSESYHTRKTRFTEGTDLLDIDFEFDREVFDSRAYRAAVISNMRQAKANKLLASSSSGPKKGSQGGMEDGDDTNNEELEQLQSDSSDLPPRNPPQLALTPQESEQVSRWISNGGLIMQTTDYDRFSSRLSRIESVVGDGLSIISRESQPSVYEHEEDGATEKRLLKSSKRKTKDHRAPKMRKFQSIFRVFSPFSPSAQAPNTQTETDEKMQRPVQAITIGSSESSPRPSTAGDKDKKHSSEKDPERHLPVKVLVLGSGNSGKTTLVKTMKTLCEGSWSDQERHQWRETVFYNIRDSMQTILEAMDRDLDCSSHDPDHLIKAVHTVFVTPFVFGDDTFPQNLGEAIELLWRDSCVQKCFHRRSECQGYDSAA